MKNLLLLVSLLLSTGLLAQQKNLLELGIKSFQEGNRQQALSYFNEHYALYPNSTAVLYNRAQLYADMDSVALALADMDNARADFEGQANYWHLYGKLLMRQKRYTEALESFNKNIELNFLDRDGFLNRGICYFKLDSTEQSIKDYDTALELDKNFPEGYYNRALSYRKLGKDAEALDDLNNTLLLSPMFIKANLERGNMLFEMGAFAAALEDFDVYLAVYTDDALALNNRGLTRSRLNDHVGAIDDFSVAIEILPDKGKFYYNRATERFFIKDIDAAIADFSKAIELLDDPFDAYFFRGKLYYENKMYAKAMADLEIAHEMRPKHRAATDLLFASQVVVFFSKYWLYVIAFAILLINGFRLYRRNKKNI